MRVLYISRKHLLEDVGGDTIQMKNTASELEKLGVQVDFYSPAAHHQQYDLIHVFNVIRPADAFQILRHFRQTPMVVSTIFVDYSEYERKARTGIFSTLTRWMNPDQTEYLKYIYRQLRSLKPRPDWHYLLRGHRASVRRLARQARLLLPNSHHEAQRFSATYRLQLPYHTVTNGIDPSLFQANASVVKDPTMILCVGRIEGRKNQLNLIKALNNTPFRLILIGAFAANQKSYYDLCRQSAASNVQFIEHIPQEQLLDYYAAAQVHVLPSWHETTGLSSLEAAAMGCNVVITDKGDTRDYFGDDAFYCDPESPASILAAIEQAATASVSEALMTRIREQNTWQLAAQQTLEAYHSILSKP